MKLNINSVEVHPQLRKKRTSSGWCPGWVLVHCGLKIDPPVCEETECHFIISLAVSVPSSVRSAQVVLDHANIALEMLGGNSPWLTPRGRLFQELPSPRELPYTKTFHGTHPLGTMGKKFCQVIPGSDQFARHLLMLSAHLWSSLFLNPPSLTS